MKGFEALVTLAMLALSTIIVAAPLATSTSDPSASIVQHTFLVPSARTHTATVDLSSVSEGNLLVVGAVFAGNDTGSVSDSFHDSWQSFGGTAVGNSIIYGSVLFFNGSIILGVTIWWAIASSSGNCTISVASPQSSTELLEAFEISDANPATISGWMSVASHQSGSNNLTGAEESPGLVPNEFALFLVGAVGNTTQTCSPVEDQTPGFIIEPYCGSVSAANQHIYGEYGYFGESAANLTVGLDVDPAWTPGCSAGFPDREACPAAMMVFRVDPYPASSSSTSTTTSTTSGTSGTLTTSTTSTTSSKKSTATPTSTSTTSTKSSTSTVTPTGTSTGTLAFEVGTGILAVVIIVAVILWPMDTTPKPDQTKPSPKTNSFQRARWDSWKRARGILVT